MEMFDSLRHEGLRQKLVQSLREKGIADENVLAAIAKVPRHFFLDSAFDWHAYVDKAIPITAVQDQTISRPYTVAQQTQLLQVVSGEKVLEIGTGSGYQAAILCEMGATLFSIERQWKLHVFAKKMLATMGYTPHLVFGDGFAGMQEKAPFSKIIVTCGAADFPQTLLEQLAVGGRMVIPVGVGELQQMYVVERLNEHDFRSTKYGECSFVPMQQGVNK
jgi:protein-L-isoaspartate(D-aspartate) O-methyltransferase